MNKDIIKLKGVSPMHMQGLLRTIQEGTRILCRVWEKDGYIQANTNKEQNQRLGRLRAEDLEFVRDLHAFTPDRIKVTGGGLCLQDRGGNKLREVADWYDLSDVEMNLVLENYYTLIPKLHGINITLEN
jgi:hypothetical protein